MLLTVLLIIVLVVGGSTQAGGVVLLGGIPVKPDNNLKDHKHDTKEFVTDVQAIRIVAQ